MEVSEVCGCEKDEDKFGDHAGPQKPGVSRCKGFGQDGQGKERVSAGKGTGVGRWVCVGLAGQLRSG